MKLGSNASANNVVKNRRIAWDIIYSNVNVARLASLVIIALLVFPTLNLPHNADAQETPSISIFLLTDNPTKWGVEVQAFGLVTGSAIDDSVTISWDDSTDPEPGIAILDGNWGVATHIYNASAVGTHEISVQLVNSTGNEIASSSLSIEVVKHSTFITYDEITDVTQGQDVTVSGVLVDGDLGIEIPDIELQFSGTGGSNLVPVSTDEFGIFSTSGASPDLAEDGLNVTATFSSSVYDPPTDSFATYDTISSSAVTYNVSDGENVSIDLTDFSASVEFEDVMTAGTLLAYDCESPANSRYLEESFLNTCINIKPALEMAEGSRANITISYPELDFSSLAGFQESDLRIFRVDGESAADITLLLDESENQIIGQTFGFSKFLIAIPDFPPAADHSRRVPVLLGDNEVEFRDVDSALNASAVIVIDDTRITIGQEATITITDPDGNINPDLVDSISALVTSSSSTPDGIDLELEETGEDSGVFEGTFDTTGGAGTSTKLHVENGDRILVNYTQSAGRLHALIEGVSEAGIAEMIDYTIDPTLVTFIPIGGAVDLQLVGAQLGPEGKVTVTMSYANAVLHNQLPPSFALFHLDGATWVDITLPGGVNETAMTVTGETTTLSPFTIGVFTGVPGGAGGGGFTGRGVVVDAVASIARASSGSGGGGAGSGSSSTGSSTSFVAQLVAGLDVELVATVPPSSTVSLQFENVLSPGNILIEQQSLAGLSSLFSETTPSSGKIAFADGLIFTTVGSVFDIKPSTGVSYQGAIVVTIPYDKNALEEGWSASDVRLLHYNGQEWEDATIRIDENSGTVTGRVSSLSPVVAATVNNGTFGPTYFDENPLEKIVDIDASNGLITSTGDPQITLLDNKGLRISNPDSLAAVQEISITNSIKNLQRTPQSYTYIVEVIDNNGIVVDLQEIQTGALQAGQSSQITAHWTTPDNDGRYILKFFVIDDTNSRAPLLLKNAVSTIIGVT